jgi:hypothetical protein
MRKEHGHQSIRVVFIIHWPIKRVVSRPLRVAQVSVSMLHFRPQGSRRRRRCDSVGLRESNAAYEGGRHHWTRPC